MEKTRRRESFKEMMYEDEAWEKTEIPGKKQKAPAYIKGHKKNSGNQRRRK